MSDLTPPPPVAPDDRPLQGRLPPGWLAALVIVVVGSSLWWSASGWYRDHLITVERGRLSDESDVYTQRLGFAMERRLALLEGLRAFVLHENLDHPGDLRRFPTFAANLLPGTSGIRVLSLAPGGILTEIYPRAGN